jgi:hypothetical protein
MKKTLKLNKRIKKTITNPKDNQEQKNKII